MPQPKTNRPRIDAICNGIKRGTYDKEIGQIQKALDDRKDVLKAEVEARVKEIYGDEYVVVSVDDRKKANPFLKAQPVPEGWVPDPDLHEQPPEAGEAQPLTPSEREREMESEIESRGAIIGPLPEDFGSEQAS